MLTAKSSGQFHRLEAHQLCQVKREQDCVPTCGQLVADLQRHRVVGVLTEHCLDNRARLLLQPHTRQRLS